MGHLEVSRNDIDIYDKLIELLPKLINVQTEINKSIIEIRIVLSDLMPWSDRTIIKVIKSEVMRYYHITVDDIEGESRYGDAMKARRVFCAMAKDKTAYSLRQVGLEVNKDHATVVNAKKRINNYKATKDILYDQYCEIEEYVEAIMNTLKINRSVADSNSQLEEN